MNFEFSSENIKYLGKLLGDENGIYKDSWVKISTLKRNIFYKVHVISTSKQKLLFLLTIAGTEIFFRQSITLWLFVSWIFCFICNVVKGAGLWSQVGPALNISQPSDFVTLSKQLPVSWSKLSRWCLFYFTEIIYVKFLV